MWTELNRFVLSLYTRMQVKMDDGQALVEYTLILALVSIAAIAILTEIGTIIVTKLTAVKNAL